MTEQEHYLDAWGKYGEPYQCPDCYGSGVTYGECCCTCGGFGFVCDEVTE